jgi:hypothetical protein
MTMLIIETTKNGKRMVKIKKDWNPSRIGKAYTPKYFDITHDAYRLQTALLQHPTRPTNESK